MKKVLFDIYHPAQVHLFKNLSNELEERGHKVLFATREKEMTNHLASTYDLPYQSISSKSNYHLIEVGKRGMGLLNACRKFDPDVVVSRVNPLTAYFSKVSNPTVIMLQNSDYTTWISRVTNPLVDYVVHPSFFNLDYSTKQIPVDGFQELAYLHPNKFEPNEDIFDHIGLSSERVFVLRFVSWDAHHDRGQFGFSNTEKDTLINRLNEHGKVILSDESGYSNDDCILEIPPHLIHDILYKADLYLGDSGTMATEAALLGTPAVRYNSFVGQEDYSVQTELSNKYNALESFEEPHNAINRALDIIQNEQYQDDWSRKRREIVDDSQDINIVLLDLIING